MIIYRNIIPLKNTKFRYTKGSLLPKPYLHFTLRDLNIPKPCTEFKLSYNNLEIDQYLENNNPPSRLRAYARYNIDVIDTETLSLQYVMDPTFKQNVTDIRGEERIFKPIEYRFIYSETRGKC